MVKFTLKNTTVIILILACLGNVVKSQKQEKNSTTEIRSLGHRRGGYVDQTVFVDRPYFVEQPLYYSYPYQYPYSYTYSYQYPYTYSYQYPYAGVPGYPYNYSYSYTRTTSRPGGVFTRPVGYISPLPYAPLPGPYFRYLGNESESNERKMDVMIPMENMTPGFINDLQDGILSNGNQNNDLQNSNEPLMQRNQTSSSGNNPVNNLLNRESDYLQRFPTLTGFNRAGLSGNERIIVQDRDDEEEEDDDENEDNNHDKNIKNNPLYNETSISSDGKKYNDTASPIKTPEIVYYNNTSNLRVLAKKGLLERVEEKVNDVFDGLKKKSNNNDEAKDLEKEDDADENNKKNDNKKSNQNGGKMIKQVFSTIEDIVSNTLSK
ncbi:unnamed protein product [Cryptosporidium hominis]|uniref:Uncharacterized protein n=1 Tax=Cryptosporidium hominis TaxID=237895 RepID=A0A0S4TD20_CRYHO|nr:hypothetical protein ChTU502y2012_387g0165 [Cryptosporidium hominis]PPA63636.1 hypothetical protein ChUKH1_08850 [Cryptosporidium hominis]CUV04404.1 unnamed protein product [Cryptosporidium hominis]